MATARADLTCAGCLSPEIDLTISLHFAQYPVNEAQLIPTPASVSIKSPSRL